MDLEVKTVSDIDALKTIEEDWDSILKNNNYSSIALTPQWLITWWKCHKYKRGKLHIITFFERKRLIGIFPLYFCKSKYRGIPVKKLSFMVNGISPHADFIIDNEKREIAVHAFLNYLASHKDKWDIIVLDKFRSTLNRELLFEALPIYDLDFGLQPSLKTPVITIDKSWDMFWSERPAKFRKTMRNKLNRVKTQNYITFEKIEDPEKLEKTLEIIFYISKRSWKGRINRAITDNPVEHSFYTTFTKFGIQKGWVNIWLLRYKDIPIAYEYHLIYNKIIYPLRADYDEGYRNMSPGSLLEYYILNDIFKKNDYQAYYSCADDYQYLRNWTDNYEVLCRIDIFNNKPISHLLYKCEYKIITRLRKIKLLRVIKDSIIHRLKYDSEKSL